MALPAGHPRRIELNDEVHARTPEALTPPMRISYLALLREETSPEEDVAPMHVLARRFDGPLPRTGVNHFSHDFGPFRVKWERHTEFTRYTFFVTGAGDPEHPFARTAIGLLPEDWIEKLPGRLIVAVHAALLPADRKPLDADEISARHFGGNVMIGSGVGGGAATALTDFRIAADGFSRMLVLDRGMSPRQAGRTLQRLLEIETYRMMALLALPVARELGPFLSECEGKLATTMETMVSASEKDEPFMLDSLTRLEAAIETRQSQSQYRFGAATAYYGIVQQRIAELREQRLPTSQTFLEFTERRLAPAMNTCTAIAHRQDALSRRVARANQLLATRVAVTRERQSQAVLESMNRRAHLQLRLQETVEGLSVAAVTYYMVGLLSYVAKGAKAAGWRIDPDYLTAWSIPLVALAVALGVRQIRKAVRPALTSWRLR